MLTLIFVGLLAGGITSISPCVLPVLPVILAASVDARGGRLRRSRPYGVIIGLVISFSFATLLGSIVLSALGLPQDLLRNAGIAVLVVIGLSLLIPKLADLLERPLVRVPRRRVNPDGNGLALGLGLGLLFVPCAGPVLATIAVVGATHRVGFSALILTAAFGVGAGVPLLMLALTGDALARRTSALRRRAAPIRRASGVVMLVVAAALALNLTDGLQRHVPGYTTALQRSVEQNKNASHQLGRLTTTTTTTAPRAQASGDLGGPCTESGTALENCGRAPEFTGLTGWLNTPDNTALSLAGLHGKVVLVDFWTYSCINCQRTLPHVEAWSNAYRGAGLEVIGVHTPEFAFEHVTSNIQAQAHALGVQYPVAIDNNYGTWDAYQNQYWPAEYLIDANGNIRHVSFGEGGYADTESLIRQLLTDAKPGVTLALPTDVAVATPDRVDQTPETYLGTKYAPLHSSSALGVGNVPTVYRFPTTLGQDTYGLSGTWSNGREALTAGPNAQLELNFSSDLVYLVLSGTGRVTVSVSGRGTTEFAVSGVPKLYTVAHGIGGLRATLTLSATPGIEAYDFTFG